MYTVLAFNILYFQRWLCYPCTAFNSNPTRSRHLVDEACFCKLMIFTNVNMLYPHVLKFCNIFFRVLQTQILYCYNTCFYNCVSKALSVAKGVDGGRLDFKFTLDRKLILKIYSIKCIWLWGPNETFMATPWSKPHSYIYTFVCSLR